MAFLFDTLRIKRVPDLTAYNRPFAAMGKGKQDAKRMKKPDARLFDAISSRSDLSDSAEQFLAQRFMIEALGRVTNQLPLIAQTAAATANRFITGAASADEVIEERVRLWNAIEGRDLSNEPEVLKIRTAICVLHPMELAVAGEALEYFFAFWQRGGLGLPELRAAVENKYGF
ncbi:hypothetical protein [Pseudoduganella sp. R-34]|uniref:hypothetical protein n=1 Tax=Pseudoduganella sp. R-34 TaxID=3404062 RepID=UPI003CF10BC5